MFLPSLLVVAVDMESLMSLPSLKSLCVTVPCFPLSLQPSLNPLKCTQ